MRRYEGLWTKRQMLPIWILQLIALGVFAGAACVLLAAAHYLDDDNTCILAGHNLGQLGERGVSH